MKRGHKTLDHMADMGLAGWGATLNDALEEIALAMFELAGEGLIGREGTKDVTLHIRASKLVDLMIEFLNELITESDIHRLLFTRIHVGYVGQIQSGWELKAEANGLSIEDYIDMLENEVKAATYYGAKVEKRADDLWYMQCVVDL